jgi:hypothetical protein
MKESQRLSTVRKHVNRAQRLLAELVEATNEPGIHAELQEALRGLQCELNHRELTRALKERAKGRAKVDQADGKSIAKDKQAA